LRYQNERMRAMLVIVEQSWATEMTLFTLSSSKSMEKFVLKELNTTPKQLSVKRVMICRRAAKQYGIKDFYDEEELIFHDPNLESKFLLPSGAWLETTKHFCADSTFRVDCPEDSTLDEMFTKIKEMFPKTFEQSEDSNNDDEVDTPDTDDEPLPF